MKRLVILLTLILVVGPAWAEVDPFRQQAPDAPTLVPLTWEALKALAAERPSRGGVIGMCAEGPVLALVIAYPGSDVSDWEWVTTILGWRSNPLYALAHFPPAPARYADGIWVDQDGDGVYEVAYLGPEVGKEINTLIPNPPCLSGPARRDGSYIEL